MYYTKSSNFQQLQKALLYCIKIHESSIKSIIEIEFSNNTLENQMHYRPMNKMSSRLIS